MAGRILKKRAKDLDHELRQVTVIIGWDAGREPTKKTSNNCTVIFSVVMWCPFDWL